MAIAGPMDEKAMANLSRSLESEFENFTTSRIYRPILERAVPPDQGPLLGDSFLTSAFGIILEFADTWKQSTREAPKSC